MVFMTVDENRLRLENLTELLIRCFPGSVICQYPGPVHAVFDTEDREIDAVFVNVSVSQRNDWRLLSMLQRNQPNRQIFVLSEDEQLRETAMEYGAWEYLVRPVTGQKLREAVLITDIDSDMGLHSWGKPRAIG